MECKENSLVFSKSDITDPVIKLYRGDVYMCPECFNAVIAAIGKGYERPAEVLDLDNIRFIHKHGWNF
jgi:hypothetical protein